MLVVLVLVVAYTAFFSWLSIERARNYNAGWYDLGIMAQTVWRAGHGYGLTFTNPDAGPGGVHGWTALRTSTHADYLLFALAPLSWFGGHTAELLLIVQSLVVAAGGWFAWRIVFRLTGRPWIAVLVSAAYVAAPPLHFATLFEFHAVTLATTFYLGAVDALLARQNRWLWVWIGLALLTKENVGITLGLLIGVLAWWQGRRALAWWALGVSWAWTLVQVLIVIPLSRPDLSASFTNKFYGGGSSDGGFSFIGRLLHPSVAWQKLATATHLHSGFQLLLPVGLVLPFLSPLIVLALPELLLYWLSDSPNQQTVVLHYHALIIPIVFLSVVFAWRAWRMAMSRWKGGRGAVDGLWVAAILAGTVFAQVRFGLLPGEGQSRWPLVAWKEHQAAQVKRAIALVPARASVALTQNLGPLLAERPDVYLLPSGLERADYIVILQRSFDPTVASNDKREAERVMLERAIAWMDSSPAYQQLYHSDRVYLYRRIGQETTPLPIWPPNLLGQ